MGELSREAENAMRSIGRSLASTVTKQAKAADNGYSRTTGKVVEFNPEAMTATVNTGTEDYPITYSGISYTNACSYSMKVGALVVVETVNHLSIITGVIGDSSFSTTGNASVGGSLTVSGGVGIDCIAPESGLKVDGTATVTGTLQDGNGDWYLSWPSIWTNIYPVGCIYLSYESTSPAQLFGGSWTQLTGVFLRAANDTATGGADSMTIYGSNLGIGTVAWMKKKIGEGTGQYGFGSGSAFYRQPVIASQAFTSLPEHEGINADVYGDPVNNMPAYQDIYAWRRTA